MKFRDGIIPDCRPEPLKKFRDERGWLAEIYRLDELGDTQEPAMAYVSLTHPGVARGPHEHADQTDRFAFFDGTYRVWRWDAREESDTFEVRTVVDCGRENPVLLVIPPGIVHAYRNIGSADAYVINAPDRLYAGENREEPVDEIRHEDDADTPFLLD